MEHFTLAMIQPFESAILVEVPIFYYADHSDKTEVRAAGMFQARMTLAETWRVSKIYLVFPRYISHRLLENF